MREYSENDWEWMLLHAYEQMFWDLQGFDPYENAVENYGDCPYYQRCLGTPGFQDGTCGYGCRDEPRCITYEPREGWPAEGVVAPSGVLPNWLTDKGMHIFEAQGGKS